MSTFEPKHDRALLSVPWLSGGGWLFKYAPHPDRAGYVFVATDLEIVLFESLTAPSIPSRLQSIASSQSQRGSSSQRTEGDIVRAAEQVLNQLEGQVMLPGRTWAAAEVGVWEHAFYDRVVEVTSGQFHWVFNMTELKSPQPLKFITKHLLGPLAATLPDAPPRSNAASPLQILGDLLAQGNFSQSLVSSTPGRSGSIKRPRAGRTVTQESDGVAARSESLSVVPESIQEAEADDEAEVEVEDEEEYRSTETSPPPTRSQPRRSNGRLAAVDAGLDPNGRGRDGRDDEVDDDEPDLPATHTRFHGRVKQASASLSPARPHQPTRAGHRVSPGEPSGKRLKMEPASQLTRSTSPVKPTPTPTPTLTSQKTKKERELEEEQLMEKRREEIKRKMGAGHGGRLGRRRAGR